jgi:hypothetical protein
VHHAHVVSGSLNIFLVESRYLRERLDHCSKTSFPKWESQVYVEIFTVFWLAEAKQLETARTIESSPLENLP